MPSKHRELIIQFGQITDALLIALVFWLAHRFREQLAFWFPGGLSVGWFHLDIPLIAPFRYYKWLYLVILPLYPILLDVNGFYTRSHLMRRRDTLWILIKSVLICALCVIAVMYFFQRNVISRGVVMLFAALSVVALYVKDALFHAYVRASARSQKFSRPVLLVGPADRNDEFERVLTENPEWNLHVVARLDPDGGKLDRLAELLHYEPISCVIFNVGRTYFSEVEKAILICEIEGVEVWLVADFVKTSIARASVDDFMGKPLLVFRTAPDITWQLVFKRLVDIAGAALGLLVLGPLVMLPAALAIRLTSPGSILFRQRRSGLHGRQFTMHKFRSMVDNAEMLRVELETFNEMTGPVFKMTGDPRVTPVGRFLRKSSIDELPQLWNVLVGDMSLVGPRPPIPSEVQQYDPWQRRRLSMKPGLTCLWQISGRNTIAFDQWMKLDLQYIDNWSLWLDFKILTRTIPVVLSGLGAR
jgi:exopolysaccharide biosynthesis polyprenyl glycosylphosphotransferase